MSHLLREHAPISEEGWRLLDEEARERLTPALAARKLVDFDGPHGWGHSDTNLGRTEAVSGAPGDGVAAKQRRVLGLVELRAEFSVSRSELDDAERGAEDIDLDALAQAAQEDRRRRELDRLRRLEEGRHHRCERGLPQQGDRPRQGL